MSIATFLDWRDSAPLNFHLPLSGMCGDVNFKVQSDDEEFNTIIVSF
jgi:hypothetical protein